MRILYVDIDSLRPDHLGCYGYHRQTSPNIDRVASQGLRFNNCYATDVPCLPSRTAIYQCRHGIHTGVINHGGVASDPFHEGQSRGFSSALARNSMPMQLRKQGYYTAQISPFGERHSALQFFCGFNEIHNPVGKGGNESAEEVAPCIEQWLERKGADDNWYLHVNLWDPHTPYRAPAELIDSLKDDPLPTWYSEEIRQQHWAGLGPHSAQEVCGFHEGSGWMKDNFPAQPTQIDSMAAARAMFDGYDAGVKWADEALGRIVAKLQELGVYEDTAIIITTDHGENLGELNIYGDHQTADEFTCHQPMIVRWPGVTDAQAGQTTDALIHHFDVAAAAVTISGGECLDSWDAISAEPLLKGTADTIGRDYLVCSQGAWSCQRMVRWDDYVMVRSYHDGYHLFPDVMVFDIKNDPHEQHDLAPERPDLVGIGLRQLDDWMGTMMRTATHPQDPMWIVMNEGGPLHTRGQLPSYVERLRATDRGHLADQLIAKHSTEM
ncbi:MAG: sulfatase [Planctomycetota bacterium]|jgi:choline-sulfatase|nr:sulfatase [Planctomycetota bacterium]